MRSPKSGEAPTNLDLVCFDVLYVELPRAFDGLEFAEPTPSERTKVTEAVRPREEPWSVRIVVSGGHRYTIAAAQFVEQENNKDAMASFLATRLRDTARARTKRASFSD